MLTSVDYWIIIGYFVITLLVGLYVSNKASGSIDEYFLGGRNIPWFILGISGMATFVDMSGSMVQSSFFYMLGVKGYWVCYRGAIALALAFLMIFIAKWMNRSKVMTNAEWMELRFGNGTQGNIARVLCAFSILVIGVAFVAYFFVGSGKFLAVYIPENIADGYYSFLSAHVHESLIPSLPNICAIIFFVIVMVYTVAAGFYGVVYTDLLQALLMIVAIVFVAVKAMSVGTVDYYEKFASSDWLSITPTWKIDMPEGYENMRYFGLLILAWILSNVFQGFAFPFDAWTSQRYYAAKNERESSLVACQWIVLFGLRFLLMMGIGILAIGITSKIAEPEMALNAVIAHYMPAGIKGIFIASLIAAAMSTLDSSVNATAAYYVKDIYKRYLNPNADGSKLIKVSYVASAVILISGVIIGWKITNINSICAWVFMGLFTGLLVPNIFKWFWWRFNGMGYAYGMVFGIIGAIVNQLAFPQATEYASFGILIAISSVGTVIGTFAGKPTDMDVLVNFYKITKPFGFWGPVRKKCEPALVAEAKKENRRDLLLLGPACVWQLTLFWMMTSLVVKKWDAFFTSFAVVAVLSFILYKFWYKNLKSE